MGFAVTFIHCILEIFIPHYPFLPPTSTINLHLFTILLSAFFVGLLNLIRVACINIGRRLFTILWATDQWLHH